jgi:DNA modification methylase
MPYLRQVFFNPVICEVCYNWFGVDNSIILDPFAGGSVRGIVAEKLGNSYIGIDLREEQIEANRINAKECNCDLNKINWITDNSQNVDNYVENESVDLIFTCPPYFDLEVYSDDKDDISNMDFEDFKIVYTDILKKCADKLKDNRFAIVVISDVRDKSGGYRDLTGITKEAFKSKGFCFYNDIVLLNAVGSAALRARKAMVNRKTTRIHQNILVFYKGNTKEIQKNFKVLENVDYSLEDF